MSAARTERATVAQLLDEYNDKLPAYFQGDAVLAHTRSTAFLAGINACILLLTRNAYRWQGNQDALFDELREINTEASAQLATRLAQITSARAQQRDGAA